MIDKAPPDHRDVRSFGRRRGRKRSARQDQILKRGLANCGLEVEEGCALQLPNLFSDDQHGYWLEIGFGGGEHLIWQAEHNPHVGFVAAEPFEDGVVKVLTAIEERQLRNIRVYPGDARLLLRALPEDSIERAFVLFPDPWPKSRHRKRRLVSNSLLTALARILREDAELRIGTDISSYAAAILEAVQQHSEFHWEVNRPEDWRTRSSDWPATRYEGKARAAGRRPYFFKFRHRRSGKMLGVH